MSILEIESRIDSEKTAQQAQRDAVEKAVFVERLVIPEVDKEKLRTALLQVEKIAQAVRTGDAKELLTNDQALRAVG